MADSTFADPDVTTFARLDGLGLRVVGQSLEPDRAILECRVVDADQQCRRCGGSGRPRDTTTRRLAHDAGVAPDGPVWSRSGPPIRATDPTGSPSSTSTASRTATDRRAQPHRDTRPPDRD